MDLQSSRQSNIFLVSFKLSPQTDDYLSYSLQTRLLALESYAALPTRRLLPHSMISYAVFSYILYKSGHEIQNVFHVLPLQQITLADFPELQFCVRICISVFTFAFAFQILVYSCQRNTLYFHCYNFRSSYTPCHNCIVVIKF